MYTVRKKFRFECSHKLISSDTIACQNIHGHSYIVEIFLSCQNLNEHDMVLDFKKVSDIVKPFINEWDHAIIVHEKDYDLIKYCKENKLKHIIFKKNPTAENMSYVLYQMIYPVFALLLKDFRLKVRIHETDTGYAEYTEEDK